jgi:HK97 family phage prohead protease
MTLGDRVRAVFRAPVKTFDGPRQAVFSQSYQPINTLIEGLMGRLDAQGREAALSIPAVSRGRNLICAISTLPLQAINADNRVQDHPLLRQIDANVPNVVTLAQLVEDLFFEGRAWLRITGFGWDGYPVSAVRYDPGQVTMLPPPGYVQGFLPSGLPTEGVIWMAGEPVPHSEVIRFDSPNPAVLVAGQRAIKRAIALDNVADMLAANPKMRGFFTPADPNADPGDDTAIVAALDAFTLARRDRLDGYVPAALKYNTVQDPTPTELQLIEMQRRSDLSLANMLGIDPEDLGINTTSRTYQNAVDRRKDRVNDVLAPYMRAITDRLSMPDVTKRGVTVRFVLDDYLKADPLTRAQVQQIYIAAGVLDYAEVREEEGLVPKVIQRPTPAPAELPPRQVPSTLGEAPMQQLNASAVVQRNFAGVSSRLTFDGDTDATFAVDQQARTITGLAVPYGQSAKSGGRYWRFVKGSIKYSAVNRVKLLRDHDNAQAVGKAIRLDDTEDGLVATFQVSPGPRGDEVLALAADGVLDGLSIGVDFRDSDHAPDPKNPGGRLVTSAALREVSLTAVPAFDDSRLTSVTASREEGTGVPDDIKTEETPATEPVTFSADMAAQFAAFLAAQQTPAAPAEGRPTVDPTTRPVTAVTQVAEALPYRFDRSGANFEPGQAHDFSTDLQTMAFGRDDGHNGGSGAFTEAGKRVMTMIAATFTNTAATNVSTLNPAVQRPDLFVDQRDYRYPIWNAINRGAPPNGVQPFMFPKFNTSGTLVADHTEGTEPTAGNYTTTSQTVTPTPLSGKASLTREVWDMQGNPAISSLVFGQMRRAWFEGLETAAGTFLNTLTAATDMSMNTGATASAAPTSAQLQGNWDSTLAALQYARGYDWNTFVIEQYLYQAFIAAVDGQGRKLYPIISPVNANGQATSRFQSLDLSGVVGIPAWGLGAGTGGAVNNSWLFDSSVVWGFATAPQRLEFPGTSSSGGYAPVAMVDLGIWGYKAFANTDIGGVRQVTYDTTT